MYFILDYKYTYFHWKSWKRFHFEKITENTCIGTRPGPPPSPTIQFRCIQSDKFGSRFKLFSSIRFQSRSGSKTHRYINLIGQNHLCHIKILIILHVWFLWSFHFLLSIVFLRCTVKPFLSSFSNSRLRLVLEFF